MFHVTKSMLTLYLLLVTANGQLVDQSIRHFPIQVSIQSPNRELIDVTTQAVNEWNKVSHTTLFQVISPTIIPSGISTCKIYFQTGRSDSGTTTMQYVTEDPVISQTYARVVITQTIGAPLSRLKTLIMHEFGHVLNIEHSEDSTSLMYWAIRDDLQYTLDSRISKSLFQSNKNLY